MRFKGLDLNLLVALDVLLTERNVSRAAERLCLSQSATSGALARLRDYFRDDLLVQVGRRMVLTPRAVTLAERVRSTIVQIDSAILQTPDFDPATADRQIRVIASDFVTIVALSGAVRHMKLNAPNISFSIEPPLERPRERLEQREVDFLLMPQRYLSPEHPFEQLFSDTYCVALWSQSRRFGETLAEDEFFNARHVTVEFPPRIPSYESLFIRQYGAERKIDAVVGSFSAVPFMLVGTDRLAVMPCKIAHVFARMLPIRILRCPIDIPEIIECLQWHSFNAGDDGLTWVREQFRSAATRSGVSAEQI